jgi:hypothetical protein
MINQGANDRKDEESFPAALPPALWPGLPRCGPVS